MPKFGPRGGGIGGVSSLGILVDGRPTVSISLLSVRVCQIIEHILATFGRAINMQYVATFMRRRPRRVDRYLGAYQHRGRAQHSDLKIHSF